jgi:hypothetical protein
MRTTGRGRVNAYQFVLGSGWVSRVVRRADLEAIPMMWHLLNGDNVLRFKDFAEIVRPRRPTEQDATVQDIVIARLRQELKAALKKIE